MELGSLATTIGLEMVVPILLGYWLDHRLGTIAVFTIAGAALGMAGGLWHLIRLTKAMGASSGKDPDRGNDSPR
jgi:F0F1-type ATP synthase assembly protein I